MHAGLVTGWSMPPVLIFALRALRRTPGLNAVAMSCLAVAIGLSTAAFTVIHGAFLSQLPAPAPDRLVMVHDYHRAGRYNVPMSSAQLTHRHDTSKSFNDLGAWYSRNVDKFYAATGMGRSSMIASP